MDKSGTMSHVEELSPPRFVEHYPNPNPKLTLTLPYLA